jgi:ATP-dependent Lon protease
MESFEKKSLEVFPEIVINKGFIHQAGFGSRAIPTYVREWIIAHYVGDDTELNENVREKIVKFVNAYVPIKGEKEVIKNELYEQMEVKFLDNLSVYVNLAKGDRYLFIPFLDENSAHVSPKIVQENEMLLSQARKALKGRCGCGNSDLSSWREWTLNTLRNVVEFLRLRNGST